MTVIKYKVSGLACDGCAKRVQNKLVEFADNVVVSLTPPQATLTNPKGDMRELNAALKPIGDYQLSLS